MTIETGRRASPRTGYAAEQSPDYSQGRGHGEGPYASDASMLAEGGRAVMPFGVMGGHYQAMGHAHLLSRMFDCGLDLQTAIDLPRLFPLPGTTSVETEALMRAQLGDDLARRGYDVQPPRTPLGGAQAIWIDWERGILVGGSDGRKDGLALGY